VESYPLPEQVLTYLTLTWDSLTTPVELDAEHRGRWVKTFGDKPAYPRLTLSRDGVWPIFGAGNRMGDLLVVSASHGVNEYVQEDIVLSDRTTEAWPTDLEDAFRRVIKQARRHGLSPVHACDPQGGRAYVILAQLDEQSTQSER